MTTDSVASQKFPCSITLQIPFPTHRLADIALRVLNVDKELSLLVNRDLSLGLSAVNEPRESSDPIKGLGTTEAGHTLLAVFEAATNRVLRVSVNSFLDNVALVLDMMATLDVDMVQKDLAAAQNSSSKPVEKG